MTADRLGDHFTPNLKCAWCGERADGQVNGVLDEHSAPKFGDLMVCAYCAQPNEYTVMGLGQLRSLDRLHPQEREEVERSMQLIREKAPPMLRHPPSRKWV